MPTVASLPILAQPAAWSPTSVAESGPYLGSAVNADSGAPLIVNDERVLATEFEKIRRSEILGDPESGSGKGRRSMYSPLWQADGKRIRRFAPLEFVGRYMKDFFDYGIADEVHELSNDTAQGNALGTLARAVDKIAVLTGNPIRLLFPNSQQFDSIAQPCVPFACRT